MDMRMVDEIDTGIIDIYKRKLRGYSLEGQGNLESMLRNPISRMIAPLILIVKPTCSASPRDLQDRHSGGGLGVWGLGIGFRVQGLGSGI